MIHPSVIEETTPRVSAAQIGRANVDDETAFHRLPVPFSNSFFSFA